MTAEKSKTLPLKMVFLGGHPSTGRTGEPHHPDVHIEDRPICHHVPPPWMGIAPYDTTDLMITWADRESDIQTGPPGARQIQMTPPRVYRAEGAVVSEEEVARVQAVVDRMWLETPTTVAACEPYRMILQGIHDQYLPQPRPAPRPAPRPTRARYMVTGGKRAYLVSGTGWQAVTGIPCPVCLDGIVQWHEAGYVPGYRRCDRCGRHFLARIQAGLTPARADQMSILTVERSLRRAGIRIAGVTSGVPA